MYSDGELVERLLAGDGAAWQEWDDRFRPVLAGIARREFRLPPEDIDDLLQDLAVALLNEDGRQLRAYRNEAPLRSWLCAVWRHRCLDLKRRRPVLGLHAPIPFLTRPIEICLTAGEALRLAGERDRFLLQMHFLYGWSQRDLAIGMRMPVNTIASCLSRAKVRLKKIVEERARKVVARAPTQ
jgi:DNA-directed RNA polymerase specialized sigma24 family protein